MKKLFITLLLVCVLPFYANARMGVIGLGGGTVGGLVCNLLDEPFDGTNGNEVSGDADWEELSPTTDKFIYDTTIKNVGSASMKIDSYDEGQLLGQTSVLSPAGDTWTVEFDLYVDQAGTSYNISILSIEDTQHGWDNYLCANVGVSTDNSVMVYGDTQLDTGQDATEETWVRIEVEIDQTGDQFNIWIDGTAGSGNPYSCYTEVNTDPDILFWDSYGENLGAGSVYIDDLCVYDGVRQ